MILPIILGVLIGAVLGFIVVKAIEKSKGKKILNSTRKEASAILKECSMLLTPSI